MPKILPKIIPFCQKQNFWHPTPHFGHSLNHFEQMESLPPSPLLSPIIPFPKTCQKSCQKFPHFAKNKIFGIPTSFFSAKPLIIQVFFSTFLFISNNFHLPKTPFSKNTMSWQKLFILLADYILSSSPSSFPSFPLINFPEKKQEKKQKLLSLPSPHTLKILSIFSLLFSLFSSPSGAGFPLQKKGRTPLNPSVFKGLERIRERRRKKSLLGWLPC